MAYSDASSPTLPRHAVRTLPPGDDDFSTCWRLIKTFFARGLPKTERLSRVRRAHCERSIWRRRFWEHAIRNDVDYAAHMDYVHFNPVKHGLVATPVDCPYSTFRACVSRGLYPPNWIVDKANEIEAGERGYRAERYFRLPMQEIAARVGYLSWVVVVT